MTTSEPARRFTFVMIDDSADARLFIELSSHAADLSEARAALELALRGTDGDEPFKDARRYLAESAAMAYTRTFMPSKVRRPVTDFVTIPEPLLATHELIRLYRNRTIAHSQSSLSTTYAVGVLDATTLDVVCVTGPTISSDLPREHLRDFFDLIEAIEDALDEVIRPIRMRLTDALGEADRAALVKEGRTPDVRLRWAAEFTARDTRRPYPTSHSLYVSRASAHAARTRTGEPPGNSECS